MAAPEQITVRYGEGVDDELQLRIVGGTLLISVPKTVKNVYLTAGPFHELRAALALLAEHIDDPPKGPKRLVSL